MNKQVHHDCPLRSLWLWFSTGKDWLNFDASLTLRAERVPLVGKLLNRIIGNPQPFPPDVMYGDICKSLPVPDGSARAVYASHVLEHLSYDDFLLALRNTFRLLEPGGEFRLIVPDLEVRARRYVDAVSAGNPTANTRFLRNCNLGVETQPVAILGRIRKLYGLSSHLWMWDEPSMTHHLRNAGFTEIRRCAYGDSDDPLFSQVEERGRFSDTVEDLAELSMSARKPLIVT